MSDSDDIPEDLNKAQRLALAAAVAPGLRSASEKAKSRRVARVDPDGKVVGYTTLAEVQKALLLERQIELEVVDGVRPTNVICQNCGKPFIVKRGVAVELQKMCPASIGGCFRQMVCAEAGCVQRPCKNAFEPTKVQRRHGRPWKCAKHAMTLEQRGANGRKAMSKLTPQQRAVMAKKAGQTRDTIDPEWRKRFAETARRLQKEMTSEARIKRCKKSGETRRKRSLQYSRTCETQGCEALVHPETARKRTRAGLVIQCRSCCSRARQAEMTADQLSEKARKAWVTRRVKAQKTNALDINGE